MRKLLPSSALCLTILLLLAGSPVFSQLINNGATITIQANAKIICTGDVQNVTGTITNNGKLEVQGNFTNSGTYTTTSDDSLIMTGAGITYLNTGGATLTYLHINKTANTDSLKLAANTTVSNLVFEKGGFTTDLTNNYILSAPFAAAFTFSPGTEITGKVRRTGWANGTAKAFNHANMLVTTNGGTTIPTDFTVTMIPQTGGGNPTQAEREVTRKFQFTPAGGTGYTADIRYPYLDAELNTNNEANLVPWQLVSTEWNSKTTSVTRDAIANYVNIPGITTTELANEWKLADPRYTFNVTALLRGPWNGTTMNTNLTALLDVAPNNQQPYNTTPFNYTGNESVSSTPGFFAAHPTIVDWVLVEFRKPSTGLATDASSSTITGRKAGFVLNNGTVVDLDGVTPIAYDIAKQGIGFITVRHRNHLGVMSIAVPSNAAGTFANDFKVLANSYKASGAASDPVILLSGVAGSYGLWAGDANKTGNLASSDINAIKLAISNSSTGYLLTDVNMTANIASSDINLVKLMISGSGTGGVPNRAVFNIQTNIPDK